MDTSSSRTSFGLVVASILVTVACSTGSEPAAPATSPTTVPDVVREGIAPTGETIDRTVTAPDGTERSYHLYVPESLESDAEAALLIAMHGGTGWGLQFEAASGFDELAEANGFLVVYPDGTEIPSMPGRRVWNGGRCCGPAQQDLDDVDDVGFIAAMIDDLGSEYLLDPSRVFATGHSNGAIMSYRLACELSDQIAGVAFQAGALEIDPCTPTQPVSMLHIHGDADTNLPIDGGIGSGIAGVAFTSPRESIETFAALDRCAEPPTESVDPDNPDVTRRTWDQCDGGTSVEFVEVAGASHAWMGGTIVPAQEARSGAVYEDFDSSLAIWTFLAGNPRTENQ